MEISAKKAVTKVVQTLACHMFPHGNQAGVGIVSPAWLGFPSRPSKAGKVCDKHSVCMPSDPGLRIP
jgi:hypothetical protein